MIVGLSPDTQLDALFQSPHTFYLGGSRRMADRYNEELGEDVYDRVDAGFVISVSEDTDYDFYATHSLEVETFLINNDFELSEANNYYLDSECVKIYGRDNVQVVLRYDADFYKTVFENINLEVYYHYLWKSSPAKPNRQLIGPFFNMLFDIAHAAKGEK